MPITSKLIPAAVIVLLIASGLAHAADKKKPVIKKPKEKPAAVEKASKRENLDRREPVPLDKTTKPLEGSKPVAQDREPGSLDCQSLERRAHEIGLEEKELDTQAKEKKEEAVALLQRAQAAEQQRIALAHADHVKSRSRVNNEQALREKERERVEFHRASDKKESEREALHRRANELERQRESIERERKARCEMGNVAQQRK